MIDKTEVSNRLNAFLDMYQQQLDLPVFVQVAVNGFLPKVPDLLTQEDKQEEIKQLITGICWVMGYQVLIYPEGEPEFESIAESFSPFR